MGREEEEGTDAHCREQSHECGTEGEAEEEEGVVGDADVDVDVEDDGVGGA